MAGMDVKLGELEARLAKRESRILLRTVLLVLIPMLVAAGWLWATVSAIDEARGSLAGVNVDLEMAEAQLYEVTNARDEANRARESAKLELKVVKEQAERLQTTADGLQEETDRLLDQMKESETEIGTLRQLLEAVKENLARVNTALEKAEAQLHDVTNARDEANRARESAKLELEGFKEQAERLQTKADGLQEETDRLLEQKKESEKEIATLKQRLEAAKKKLRQSAAFVEHIYNLNWAAAKGIASVMPRGGEMLSLINSFRERKVGWDWANSRERGFTSPGFAGFILQEMNVLSRSQDPARALRRLRRFDGPPKPGDVVLYEAGFAMFYFRDRAGKEFVVGMTVTGIVALDYNFGPKRLGVLDTELSR